MATEARPADFDSATAMVAATARFLDGHDFPILGKPYGAALRPALLAINLLPEAARDWLYRVGSGREGQPSEVIATADQEALARQVVARYPDRRYPGALIGSNPGSAVHLAAALGMPLLPQTQLLPLRHRGLSVDDPIAEIDVARPTAEELVRRNPHLSVHHMSDPMNDRRTLARFSYFRVKRGVLGQTYERFLKDHVEPGGVLYLVDSRHTWPTTRISERYYFQFGGIGGLTPEEYYDGSDRVAEFLAREGARHRRWCPPEPDAERPEAEWGLGQELAEDVERFAGQEGFRMVRICFDHADDLSPLVAELYRHWYERLGRPTDRLFAESFVLLDPYWVLRAAAVPYWITFNAFPAVERLEQYLDASKPYRRVEANLISNGTWTVDLAGPERWEKVFSKADEGGCLAGVDAAKFPSDMASFARYRDPLRKGGTRFALPGPLEPPEVEEFAHRAEHRFDVTVS